MSKQKRSEPTNLNEYDRKILEEYAHFYINFVESITAKTDNQKDQNFQSK